VNRTTQSTNIKQAINQLLDKGFTDKQDIYTKVVEELGVPRPTVRRVARDLRNELLQKIKILQSEVPELEGNQKTVESSACWSNIGRRVHAGRRRFTRRDQGNIRRNEKTTREEVDSSNLFLFETEKSNNLQLASCRLETISCYG
jgi:hypothetical protein